MKVSTEGSYLRRKSNTSTLYLHIPWLNYAFLFFQARASYISVKDYFNINRDIPSLLKACVMSIKFAFFGALASGIFGTILLVFSLNPFGHMAVYYMGLLSDLVTGLVKPETASYYFGQYMTNLGSTEFNISVIFANLGFMFVTYLIFAWIGASLAVYNLRSDAKRNITES